MANEISGLHQAALQPAQSRPVALAPVSGQASSSHGPAATDTVTLTDAARLMQRLEAAVAKSPQVDGARVDHIKQQIANGAYQVDPHQLAKQVAQFEAGGGSTTRQHSVDGSRTDNGYTYTVSTTTPRGTAERTVSMGYDADTGLLTRDVTRTNAQGETVSSHGEIQKTDDGFTKSGTITGPNGETISRTVDFDIDREAHTLTRTATVDGVNHDFTHTTTLSQDASSGEYVRKDTFAPDGNGLT